MKATETILKGCFVLEPKLFQDDRGYFYESYKQKIFEELTGQDIGFIQDNQAASSYGVVRGLHMQRGTSSQAKLVRALAGSILDVAVDMRKDSPTYGQHVAVELTGANHKQLFVPHGFLHGYSVLSEAAMVAYKCDAFYDPSSEDAVHPLDADLDIDWRIPESEIVLSAKDKIAQGFTNFEAVNLAL